MIKSVRRYNRAASRPPNINIIPHLLSSVNSTDIQTFSLVFMEHPILKIPRTGCNMKIQKRSESNVLNKLTPIKTAERRGYVNDGTQHEYGITLDLRRDSPKDQGLFPLMASRGRRHFFVPNGAIFLLSSRRGNAVRIRRKTAADGSWYRGTVIAVPYAMADRRKKQQDQPPSTSVIARSEATWQSVLFPSPCGGRAVLRTA